MSRFLPVLVLLVANCLAVASAAPLAPGATLAPIAIADQHGKPASVDETTRLVMFSRDMGANKLAKSAFGKRPAQYLPDAHAMYLIDVSGMPGFVTNTFAIPKMQKYGYRIFLDREGALTATLPSHKKEVTLVHLDHLKVTGIEYATSAEALNRAVDAAGR